MWLIVGLGNPGSKYLLTRHNVGFMAIDYYLANIGQPPLKSEHKAVVAAFSIEGIKVLMAKPQTYMNHSGESVQALAHFYKVPVERIVVLHDEIEQPFGQTKLQFQRGHGGHNGVKDIHARMGSDAYYRFRIGVGRPAGRMDVSAHVLSPFSHEEQEQIPRILENISDGIESLIFEGFPKAANKVNSWKLSDANS